MCFTPKCTVDIDNFLCTITFEQFYSYYYNQQLLFTILQLTTFVWPVVSEYYCILQKDIINFSYIDLNSQHKLIATLQLVLNFSFTNIKMQNMTTECSDILNYNNSRELLQKVINLQKKSLN